MTIRTAFRFALSAILGTAALAAAETTYLPGAAEVTGLAGARFSSTLELSNPGATGTTATIGLVPMAGKATPAPVTRTLAAGESLRIPEALKTLFGLTDGAAGTLTLTSDEPLLANLSTRNVAAPEGAYGLGLLPVPSSDLLGAGETGHSIWVSQSADPAKGYRTNLSVTLVDPGTVVEVRVVDADGRVAGSATVTAETAQVWQQPAASLIGYATDLPVGRAEFEVKAGRATAYAVVNDNVTSDAIALQTERVVPGPTDRLISGAALAPGQLGSFWSTDLRLFNPGSTAVDATIQSVGASREASVVVAVPAKGVVEVTRVLALLGFPEGTACALRVKAGATLLVAARTNNVDPSGIRKGTFSAQQFVTSWPAGLLGAGTLGFFNGVDQSFNVPGVRTNLTVVGGPEGAAGELVLRDAAGLEQGRRAFSRGPGEWGQLSVADWFAPATVPGNSRVDVAVAAGALDAFVSRIDNGSGDAITRPVALLGGQDCTKIAVTSFAAEPKPIGAGVPTTFSWTVALDPPTAELTSQSIRFDGEPEIELGKEIRSYTRSFDAAAARSATLTVRKGNCVKTRSLTFFVCGPLSLEPTTLPDATAFAAYPPRTITVPGATAPTTFTVAAGVLPGGMSLSAEGELSGRPDEVGLFTFTAKAVDANGCVGTREYALRVFCPTLRIVPTTLPAGTVAVPYPSIRFTVTGGSGSGTWSATGLPPGLALSTVGQLSGTPTAAGSYTVAVRFRDSSGCIGTATYTVLVCNTLVLTPGTLTAATAGTPYGPVTFTAGGATGAPTWTVTTGSLPAGVTLNAGTGALTGTPTVVGNFPFTVTATDSLGCTGSVAVSLLVNCPVITVNPATLVAAFEDAPYTATLTQTGGNPGATFTVVAGTLPAGLALNPATGVLSGTVAIPGGTNFTVRATDPVTACFGDRAYTFTVTPVNDAPSFVKGPDVGLLEDSGPYSAAWATAISAGPVDESGQLLTFNVTGNTNPALFSVAPTVSAAGVLGFTPAANASGTATITLTLSDNGGTANGGVDTSAAQTFVVTVTDVNDAPSFTKGPDVTVLEDSAAYSAAWATALSTGPAPEAGQTLSFHVTGNTNAALFSAPPAVSPAGVLSFTPAANANGTATITLTLSDNGGTANGGVDTSAAQTFVVNLTPVNDAPSFTKGADVTVLEDSGANTTATWATAILAGPADESAQTVSFAVTGNTNAALFAVAPAVSPAGALTFTPAANASGSATVTLTLSDNGGTANGGADTSAAQSFVINVTDVNDAPSFTKGADQTVLEDSGAQTVNTWATAISAGPPSESGQTVAFNVTGNTNAGLFSVAPAVSSTGVLTYTPAANANGTATITLTLSDNGGTANGGVNVSAAQTFVVNVTAVNDAPSFTKGADVTVLEESGAQTVNPWATALLAGPADESAQTFSFSVTGNTNAALFSVAPAVSPTGVLTFTPAANASGSATITLTLTDSGGTANAGVDTSAAQSFVINVTDVNDPPSFTKGADVTVLEDAAAYSAAWATAISAGPASESGQTVAFSVTGNTNAALFSVAPAVSPAGVLSFTPAANANGTATITLTLTDNGGTANGGVNVSPAQTFVVNVTAVNDAPSFTKGADQTVFDNAGAQTVPGWATAITKGPADEAAQTVTFSVTGNTNPTLFSVAPAIDPSGTLTYTPVPSNGGSATITVVLTDSGGTANGGVNTSAAQTFAITFNHVNVAPSFTKGADVTVLEDAAAYSAAWATSISAGPVSESGQTVAFNVTGNTNPGLFSVAPAVSPTGVLSFTPAANANGSATITLTLTDDGGTANGGVNVSAAQSFVVNVTAVNDAPSFTKGADQTVLEESGAQTVNGWATALVAGPADESAQTFSFNITGNTNAALFSVAPAVSPTGVLTFTPAANASGSATITLTLTDNGGTANGGVNVSAAQSFVINVTDVNDPPSFTKGADATVLEDAAAYSAAWATAISAGPASESAQTVAFSVTGNTNPGLFSVAPAVSPTGVLSFTPAANANGSATITLALTDNGGTANGGVNVSAAQSFVISVTAVNDAPSFTKGADQTVFDNAGAQTVPGWATAITMGPADEATQTASFSVTGNTNPSLFSVAPAIDPAGTLTFTPVPSNGGSATITIVLTDNGGTANGGVNSSASQTFTITFTHVNVAPSFTKGADQTVNEDAPAQTVNPWATAISAGPPVESGQTLTFGVTGNTNPTLFSAGPAISPTGVLTYTPAPNAFGSATITVTLSDNGGTANGGADTSAAQTFVITINPVNDAPSFTKGPDQSVNEDSGAQTANPWATALSAGPASEAGQTLTFNVTGNTNPTLFSAGPAISSAGVLTYTPAPNAFGAATITVVLQDNGGVANGGIDTSAAQTFVITVGPVNDAPSFAKGADQTVLEDAGAQTVNPWATAISAGPASESGQTLTFNVTGNTNPTLFSAGPAISPAGVLTYTSAPNANGSATITVTLSDNGGTANGGVDTSASQTFVISVTPVNDPPSITTTLVTYTTPGNTQLHVAGATLPGVASWTDAQSVTAKAGPFADIDGPGPLLIVPASGSSANGGTFSIAADGSFTYVPAAGFTGADSFTYQVTDQNTPTAGLAIGTVSIAVGARVWYVRDVVDANNAAGGDGRSTNAFDSIAALNAATTNAGDIIYVFEGSTATTPLAGSVTLKDGQKLWGQGIALNVPGFATPLVAAANKARIRTTTASTDVVSVPATAGNRQNVEVRGLDLEATGATSNAIDVTASGTNLVGVTISDNNVRGATAEGIDLNASSTGTFAATVSANAITATGNGIDARTGAATTLSLDISNDTVVSTANGILIDGSGGGSVTITGFANNTVDGNTGGTGISVNSARFDAGVAAGYQQVAGGTTVVGALGNGVGTSGVLLTNVTGDLAFTDLDVYASNGTGLRITGTGAVNTAAGTGTRVTVAPNVGVVEATNGPAVDVNNATVDLQLSSLRSTNSPTTGVSLVTVVDGTSGAVFSAGAGSVIASATGTDFNVDGGNATISYAGPITNTAGRSVSVINRTADTVTFTGAISDAGTGVFLNANGSSTVTFSGGLVANTGVNAAFTATGGGTVVVCDENPCGATGSNGGLVNTLTTTTGTALTVANTNIGAGDLEFRSISSNGGANGIFLQNTGAAGGLKVKGTGSTAKGGDASGGTIRNMFGADGATAGNGIYLESTQNVLLQRMQLNDFQNSAIRGFSVTGFTLQYSTINGVSGDSSAATEGALAFGTIIPGANGFAGGTNLIDNCVVRGAVEHNMEFYSYLAGSNYSLTISNSDVTNNSAAFGGDGIQIELGGGYVNTATVSIQNCFFDNNKSQGVQGAANGSSTLDITINGCTLQRTTQGNEGFIVSNGSNGDAIVHMTNNTLSGVGGTALFVGQTAGNASASSSLTAVIRGNNVTHPVSATNHAIIAFLTSTVGAGAPANILIDGNTVVQNSTSGIARAILVDTPDAGTNPAFTATVTSNTVSVGDNVNGVGPIVVQARQSSAGCFDVRNNAASFPNGTPAGVFGIRVRQAGAATANLEQGVSAGTAATVLTANNPAATTEVLGTVNVVANSNCATPPS